MDEDFDIEETPYQRALRVLAETDEIDGYFNAFSLMDQVFSEFLREMANIHELGSFSEIRSVLNDEPDRHDLAQKDPRSVLPE